MTSFGKLEVAGPGALALLDRVCDSRIDRPAGSVIYTQFLNRHGGIVADVTVTRLGEERFRVITGAATVDGDRGWLELNRRARGRRREIARQQRRARRDRDLGAARAGDAGGCHRRRRFG